MPKVSVLIPTYNYARFLPEAIESVLAQDLADFELLIFDDASTDDSREILQRYAAKDSRIRAEVHARNIGMVNNWNYALREARGEYIKFLFGDDKLVRPNALLRMALMLDQNPSAKLAACARLVVDDSSRPVELWRDLPEGVLSGQDAMVWCLIEHANLIGEPTAVMFRRKDMAREFNPAYRQIVDLDLWFNLLETGDLIYTREALCAFRQHGSQQSAHNSAAGVAWKEHLLFAANYAMRPWVPRRAVFKVSYVLRRSMQRDPALRVPEMEQADAALAQRLGTGPRALFWLFHRLGRPVTNLRRKFQRRRNIREIPMQNAC